MDNAGKKILIADDSALVAAMLANMLKGAGYQTARAADGIEATQKAYSEMPDLILLDIFMPRMNGYQVCRLLKNDPTVAHIPVIILTGSDSSSAEFWSLQTGADAFMTKGFEPPQLLAEVERQLAAHPSVGKEPQEAPAAEEILSQVSILIDRELYNTTVERLELQTVLRNLHDGIVRVDLQRNVSNANRALCQMLGVEEAALVGQPAADALGGGAGALVAALYDRLQTGETVPPEDTEVRAADGRVTPVAIMGELLCDYNNQPVGCVFLVQDITRRKQIESMVEQLKALDKMKDDLTGMIVHDLRTPLTSLIGGLQSIEVLGDLNEDQKEFIDMSVSGGQTLLGMINDLLDVSKMEDGSMKLEYGQVRPGEVINRALQQVATLAREKDLTLVEDIAPEVTTLPADEEKLRRIMVNLLGNALKFTPRGGTITLEAKPDGDCLRFGVRDTGEGIPKEAFERIFEKFGQVETRKEGRKMSTGLGLTFCKLAAEAHGGRIWVESEVGVGSVFYFTIPLVAAGEAAGPPRETAAVA